MRMTPVSLNCFTNRLYSGIRLNIMLYCLRCTVPVGTVVGGHWALGSGVHRDLGRGVYRELGRGPGTKGGGQGGSQGVMQGRAQLYFIKSFVQLYDGELLGMAVALKYILFSKDVCSFIRVSEAKCSLSTLRAVFATLSLVTGLFHLHSR